MTVLDTPISGVKIIEPDVFKDSRGHFCETYNAAHYKAAGITADFMQDNESFSMKGVVRGLHWQSGEHCQAKLVRVIKGAVRDVAVGVRKDSPTFGKYVAEVLSAENWHPFFVPRGFAHGFVVLEGNTLFSYKCGNLYCKEAERGLMFNDSALWIEWPELGMPILLSEKDQRHPSLADIEPYCE